MQCEGKAIKGAFCRGIRIVFLFLLLTFLLMAVWTKPADAGVVYSVNVWAWDASDSNGWISEPINMDGSPTNFSTPHTFADLTGTHTFTLPNTDDDGNPLSSWNTGETSATITVNSDGSYTARYAPPLIVSINPPSWTMDLGQSKTLTAAASGGSGNYTSYQWYVDGVTQDNATSSIFNYAPANIGSRTITLRVADSLGATSQSSPVVVTVNSALITGLQSPSPTTNSSSTPTHSPTPLRPNSLTQALGGSKITIILIITVVMLAAVIPAAVVMIRRKNVPKYEINKETGMVTFGDGEDGKVPPSGVNIGYSGMPAARIGDQTSHGTPLSPGPGSPNVLIGGQPAWRVSDFHNCPLATPNPHIGGKVSMGSTTVLINGLPAARVGDMIAEAGPPNVIVSGCTTVMIG